MNARPVTLEAHDLIRGERAQHYGPPHHNFEVIADFWDAYLRPAVAEYLHRLGIEEPAVPMPVFIDENDVCNLMTLLKIAREATGQGYHRDSTVDVIGYQAIKEILQTPIEGFLEETKQK